MTGSSLDQIFASLSLRIGARELKPVRAGLRGLGLYGLTQWLR
jgi:hypothetical protein